LFAEASYRTKTTQVPAVTGTEDVVESAPSLPKPHPAAEEVSFSLWLALKPEFWAET